MYQALTLLSLFGILSFLGIQAAPEFVYKCPTNFTKSSEDDNAQCHYFSTEDDKLNWDDANVKCIAMEGHLVKFEDIEENNYVSDWIDDVFWMGLNDVRKEDTYEYTNVKNVSVPYENWASFEPSHRYLFKDEDCVSVRKNGKWNDKYCTSEFRYVCETSIIKELSCSEGWISNPEDTEIYACYQLVKTPTNYENASIICQETPGAVLYTPTSDAENDFIISEMGEHFLIDLTDVENEKTFLTTTGELQTYKNWCFWFFEPNNGFWFFNENCVIVYAKGWLKGCQNDVRCSKTFPFVCKLV